MVTNEEYEAFGEALAKKRQASHRCPICGIYTVWDHGLCLSCERNAGEQWDDRDEAELERREAQGDGHA